MNEVLLGVAGAALSQLLHVVAVLNSDNPRLSPAEIVAAILLTLAGAGAVLTAGDDTSPLGVAVMGAVFPQTFSSLVAAATKKKDPGEPGLSSLGRTLLDFLAWRI